MFLVLCSCLCPIHWSQVLSREWKCSWSSADRRCSNYIWVINNFIAYEGATYIRCLTVCIPSHDHAMTCQFWTWMALAEVTTTAWFGASFDTFIYTLTWCERGTMTNIFRRHFKNTSPSMEKFGISIDIFWRLSRKCLMDNKSALIRVMVLHRTGDTPLPETMFVIFYDTNWRDWATMSNCRIWKER